MLLAFIIIACFLYLLIAAWALYTIAAESKEYWDVRHIFYSLVWPITLAITLWQQWRATAPARRKAKEEAKK